MSVEAHPETLEFKAEVSQVLNLVIRSLYSNKEIFLRELISNASDAAEKLRFEALTDSGLYAEDSLLRIRVSVDQKARTVTVSDNGIGMSRQEIVATIGSIASSGTRKFLETITGDQAKDSQLIGQFGVGFYSVFIVADKVTIETRRAGLEFEHGVRWESTGEGRYQLETIERADRGTAVTLHLKEEEKEFADPWKLRSIISKFSDHIALPVEMLKETYGGKKEEGDENEDDKKPEKTPEWEAVNQGKALWMRSREELQASDYHDFYKHVSHDWEEPLAYLHNRVEGTNEYTTLLFIPQRAPWDLWDRDQKHGVKLYVKRVFIMDEADKLLPRYLRFVKGVVDADDLPLNVSREILQHNRKIDSIRTANVKRILGLLEKMATDEGEKYQKFWKEFGKVLKEGPGEDFGNREKIAGLLRFTSTQSTGDAQDVSLDAYIGRMKEGQKNIYYITADTAAAARHSPHLEVFRKKGIEVLLLSDRVDEWLVSGLTDYKDKHLQSVVKGALDLGELSDQDEKSQKEKAEQEHKGLLERIKAVLGERVKEVQISARLTDSPACLVVEVHDMSPNLARVLKSVGQEGPKTAPILEININHPLLVRLESEGNESRFADLSAILLDQATLAEGGTLEDPASFVQRLNQLMLSLM